ncbi:transferase family protein [Colletotrichum kahawae]|uniref:Transferase family protein n=1 Tax=Colletotrichum kahawae TaxID=34407 RepID=A0AAD9XVT9_COLKA|nr:transferase family protein [Colletotrichum kahawae]
MTSRDSQSAAERCRVQATRRIHPKTPAPEPTISKLSIIDATVARFTPTAAIWLYDKTDNVQLTYPSLFETVGSALSETLDDVPHFAGQIQWAAQEMVKHNPVRRHLGRLVVSHGSPKDPGVELIIAEYDANLDQVVPSRNDRGTNLKEWNASNFQQSDLLPNTKIALSSLDMIEGLPSMAIQLMAFRCGGIGISVMIAHPLADAACLMTFMNSWAARSRALLHPESMSGNSQILKPVFDPSLLDQAAQLRDGGAPDSTKIQKARSLPMHRFDWWAEDAPGFPSGTKSATQATMPSAEEMDNTQLTHVWTLINRARGLQDTQDNVYLDITLGLRQRVSPPLPETFVGSPLLLGFVEKTGTEASTPELGPVAGAIRNKMDMFTPDAVAAYIHDAAQTYELDFFGTQQEARYVQGVMPKIDGLVQVMDVADTGDFDVSICIQREAMERLLSDPLLRKYES